MLQMVLQTRRSDRSVRAVGSPTTGLRTDHAGFRGTNKDYADTGSAYSAANAATATKTKDFMASLGDMHDLSRGTKMVFCI
jgi:hypothetical protein